MEQAKAVGDYLLFETIGKGQFGHVCLAKKRGEPHMRESSQVYACKVVSIRNKSPRQIVEMEKEVQILSRLEHPNIIKLHQALRTQNNLYLFMDYCDEGDLKGFIRKVESIRRADGQGERPQLTEQEARYVISQVVESMRFLNLHNIVHRDLKIDNILVRRKPNIS